MNKTMNKTLSMESKSNKVGYGWFRLKVYDSQFFDGSVLTLAKSLEEWLGALIYKCLVFSCEIKKILKPICPPFLWSTLTKLRPRYGYFGVYSKFPKATFDDPWTTSGWIFGQKQKILNVGSENKRSFFSLSHLDGYNVIPCFLVNLLSQKNLLES